MELLTPNITLFTETSFELAECPRWDWRSKSWFWVDIPAGALYRYKDSVLEVQTWEEPLGCAAMQGDHGFVLAFKSGVYALAEFNGEREMITPLISSHPRMRFNDGRAAPGSRFVAGTRNGSKEGPQGQFHQVDHNGEMTSLPFYAWTCNGLAFSPCGTLLYWADTGESRVYKASYCVTSGAVGEAECFADLSDYDGRPDGAAVDDKGGYWVAMYGGKQVLRISPKGMVTHSIPVPVTNPTMVAFGGEEYQEMLITSAPDEQQPGRVLYINDIGWTGISEPLADIAK